MEAILEVQNTGWFRRKHIAAVGSVEAVTELSEVRCHCVRVRLRLRLRVKRRAAAQALVCSLVEGYLGLLQRI